MITTNPHIMCGKPCVAGTRITVEMILEYLEAGSPFAEILDGYPQLQEQDIRDAIAYARTHLREEEAFAAK